MTIGQEIKRLVLWMPLITSYDLMSGRDRSISGMEQRILMLC